MIFFSQTLKATNACFSNPCLNGGTCTVDSNGAYYCTCPDFYNGQNCNICNYKKWKILKNSYFKLILIISIFNNLNFNQKKVLDSCSGILLIK